MPELTRDRSPRHDLPARSGSATLWGRIRHPQLRTRVLAGALAVTLTTLAGFGFAAVAALHRYLLTATDGNLETVLSKYYPVLEIAQGLPGTAGRNAVRDVTPKPGPSFALQQLGNTYRRSLPDGESITLLPLSTSVSILRLLLPRAVDGYDVELVSASGTVVPLVGGDPDLVPRLPTRLSEVAAHRSTVSVMSRNGSAQLRLTAESAGGYTLVVATSLEGLDSTLRRLELIVAFGVLSSGLLVFAGVGLVVRRGLRPVEKMAATADQLTAGDLTRRVSQHDSVTEVGRLGAALNGMLDRVQAAVREREASERTTRQFFADASHELRTPLASLRANAELYQQGALLRTAQVDEAMCRIATEARRMGILVDGMLRLARLDQHPRPRDEHVDASALIFECIERARIAGPRHVWQPRIPPGLITTGDEEMLRRAIDNLLANVATHTPAGTTATITASATDTTITIEVSDDGPGVPADQVCRIFDRFYRASALEHHAGSGLGLAIVAAIAAAHHGAVRAALNHPHGLRVTLTLPASRQPGRQRDRSRVMVPT